MAAYDPTSQSFHASVDGLLFARLRGNAPGVGRHLRPNLREIGWQTAVGAGAPPMTHETAFEMAASGIRFGSGVTREVGMDLAEIGSRNVLVITDPVLRRLRPVEIVLESLEANR